MRKEPLVTGEYYHLYNRGVNSGLIFKGDQDKERYYQSMFLFNNQGYRRSRGDRFEEEVLMATASGDCDLRGEPFVTILGFCLMSNHYHMLVRQEVDNGISRFMHKLSKGYARYANIRHDRTGPLFEGKFESRHLFEESHFMHLVPYIHLNALDAIGVPWREGQVKNWSMAEAGLDAFQWSSHGVYMGRVQTLPVVDLVAARDLFPTPDEYVDYLRSWSQREAELKIIDQY